MKTKPPEAPPITRQPATHVRFGKVETGWMQELEAETGQTWPDILKTLLREEMKRRKKRGER
jgi:hypothetical protein